MQYIYVRVSTDKQDNDNQIATLTPKFPNATVVQEVASSMKRRPELTALVNKLAKGDELIVYALDRLGRKTSEVLKLIEDLERKGVILKSMREGVDYGTIVGKLVTQILCSVAEMERNMISERTKMALAAKKKQGVVLGRRRQHTDDMVLEAKELRALGHSYGVIAKRLGVSKDWAFTAVNGG